MLLYPATCSKNHEIKWNDLFRILAHRGNGWLKWAKQHDGSKIEMKFPPVEFQKVLKTGIDLAMQGYEDS